MVTFTFSPTKDKKHFGIYIKSVSGLALLLLHDRLPELKPEHYALYSDIETKMIVKKGAVRLYCDRLARVDSEKKAIAYCKRLNKLPDDMAVNKIRHLYLKPIEKDLVILKVQYYKVLSALTGSMQAQFTTQDRTNAESVAIGYAERNIPAKLRKTVARAVILSKKALPHVINDIEVLASISQGRKGEIPNAKTIYTKRK
jgi:hypothetical protein